MTGEGLGARSFDNSHPNGLSSSLDSWLREIRWLLTTVATVATVDDNDAEFFFEYRVCSPLHKHTVYFDCAEAHRDRVCDSQKAHTVLVLIEFQKNLSACNRATWRRRRADSLHHHPGRW